ncbi:MAG: hypothetical protein HYY16_04520 [Planctomycetes bacterium]|nr:hypothetical protein [Planctomycetota bacterium]
MRRFALVALAALVPIGCRGGTDDAPLGNVTYRATTWYSFKPGSSTIFAQPQVLMTSVDLAAYQNQTGITQSAGQGFIYGHVRDAASGSAIADVILAAVNDAGLSAGTPIYRSTSGAFVTTLGATTSSGDFIIFNVAPGRVNLRCVTGAAGNMIVKSVADETTLVTVRAVPTGTPGAPAPTAGCSGTTRRLKNAPDLPEGSVVITGMATGSPFPMASDAGGPFNSGSLATQQTYFLKLSKTGFIDTYNHYSHTGPTAAGDLLIVHPTDRDSTDFKPFTDTLTAGTAVVRGQVTPASGTLETYTITCTRLDGAPTGDVWYGDANGRPVSQSSTSSSGVFYIYNCDPGTLFIRASKAGFGGSVYVDTFADSITLIQGQLSPVANAPGSDSITVSGTLIALTAVSAIPGATIDRLGQGAVPTNNSGAYSMTNVPSNHQFVIRTSRP